MGKNIQNSSEIKFSEALKDLNVISYTIRNSSGPEAYDFRDGKKLFNLFSKEIENYFDKNRILYKEGIYGDMGGGGGFITIVEDVLNNIKDFLINYNLLYNLAKPVGILIMKLITKDFNSKYVRSVDLQPRLSIELLISTDKKCSKSILSQLQFELSHRLVNLLTIGESLIGSMIKTIPLTHYDLTISCYIKSIDYGISISIPEEKRVSINTIRLKHILRKLVIKKICYVQYDPGLFYSIRRKDLSEQSTLKTYYLYCSTRILSDYFGIKKEKMQYG